MKNKISNEDPCIDYLTGMIASLPDEEPPGDFMQAVMQQIIPKPISFRQRFWRFLIAPFTVIAIRPLHAAVTIVLLVGLLFVFKTFWISDNDYPYAASSKNANTKLVNFILDYPSAKKAAVIGSFNHWQPEHYHMHRNLSDGTWQIAVALQPGRHAYAFIIDNTKIIADPRALWEQDDGFGTRNSILTIDNEYDNGSSDENRI